MTRRAHDQDVGNMCSDVKGHPYLIASAPAVLREFPDTQFIFGRRRRAEIQFCNQAEDLGITHNFRFLGRRADIPDILTSCDIAVLPSRAEGLPNAVLQFLNTWLQECRSSRALGGNAELVQAGITGMLVPSEDSAALSLALLKLLAEPPLARQLAQRWAHEFAVRNFSLERLVQEVDVLYTEGTGHC